MPGRAVAHAHNHVLSPQFAADAISPSGLYLIALFSRLVSTCRISLFSTRAIRKSGGKSTTKLCLSVCAVISFRKKARQLGMDSSDSLASARRLQARRVQQVFHHLGSGGRLRPRWTARLSETISRSHSTSSAAKCSRSLYQCDRVFSSWLTTEMKLLFISSAVRKRVISRTEAITLSSASLAENSGP